MVAFRTSSAAAVVLAVTATFPLAVVAQDDAAMTTLHRYSAAINAGDCETVYSLTSEAVTRREGFPKQFREMLCASLATWHKDGLKEVVGSPKARLADGWRRVVFVRATRERVVPPNHETMDFDYIVHSSDGGTTWRVLDLGCVDARWVHEIFPAYAGTPEVHSAWARLTAL